MVSFERCAGLDGQDCYYTDLECAIDIRECVKSAGIVFLESLIQTFTGDIARHKRRIALRQTVLRFHSLRRALAVRRRENWIAIPKRWC